MFVKWSRFTGLFGWRSEVASNRSSIVYSYLWITRNTIVEEFHRAMAWHSTYNSKYFFVMNQVWYRVVFKIRLEMNNFFRWNFSFVQHKAPTDNWVFKKIVKCHIELIRIFLIPCFRIFNHFHVSALNSLVLTAVRKNCLNEFTAHGCWRM